MSQTSRKPWELLEYLRPSSRRLRLRTRPSFGFDQRASLSSVQRGDLAASFRVNTFQFRCQAQIPTSTSVAHAQGLTSEPRWSAKLLRRRCDVGRCASVRSGLARLATAMAAQIASSTSSGARTFGQHGADRSRPAMSGHRQPLSQVGGARPTGRPPSIDANGTSYTASPYLASRLSRTEKRSISRARQ